MQKFTAIANKVFITQHLLWNVAQTTGITTADVRFTASRGDFQADANSNAGLWIYVNVFFRLLVK